MKKAEIIENLSPIFNLLRSKVEAQQGMTSEELKALYDQVYYLYQQSTK